MKELFNPGEDPITPPGGEDPKPEPPVSSGAAGASGPSVAQPTEVAMPNMGVTPTVTPEPTLKDVMAALNEIKEALRRIEAKGGGG